MIYTGIEHPVVNNPVVGSTRRHRSRAASRGSMPTYGMSMAAKFPWMRFAGSFHVRAAGTELDTIPVKIKKALKPVLDTINRTLLGGEAIYLKLSRLEVPKPETAALGSLMFSGTSAAFMSQSNAKAVGDAVFTGTLSCQVRVGNPSARAAGDVIYLAQALSEDEELLMLDLW